MSTPLNIFNPFGYQIAFTSQPQIITQYQSPFIPNNNISISIKQEPSTPMNLSFDSQQGFNSALPNNDNYDEYVSQPLLQTYAIPLFDITQSRDNSQSIQHQSSQDSFRSDLPFQNNRITTS